MKSASVAILLISLAALFTADTTQGQAQRDNRIRPARQPVSNQYIVVLNPNEDPVQVGRESAVVHQARLQHIYRRALNGFSARLTAAAAARLAEDPRVRFIEEDSVVYISQVQTGPPSGLDRIDQRLRPLDGSYAYGELATFVRVHVIDTGIRISHQDFGGRALIAGDYVDDDGDGDPLDVGNDDGNPAAPDGADCNGHGTHVAGTIGGTIYGVAKKVTLHSHRVLFCNGTGTVSSVIAAVEAVTHDFYRPAVVNMSLGSGPSDAMDSAIRESIASGVTYVVAAGNSNADAANVSPARVAEAVTVAAIDGNDLRASFSNFGTRVDLFAPGVAITSAWVSSDIATASLSGTSMAAPHVAGVAALYLSRQPDMTPDAVRNQLVNAATPNVVANPGTGSPNLLAYSDLTHLSAPAVNLLRPNGSEKVLSGKPFTIDWEASDPDGLAGFDVLLSTDGGVSYAPLPECPALDGGARQCVWAAPNPLTTTARVRIVARDLSGDSAFDQSSGNFSIVTLPELVITATSHSSGLLAPGGAFTASDTVRNLGNTNSGASVTRYYLSLDAAKSANDVRLSGSRSVAGLVPDAESTGPASLSVPTSMPPGTYRVLACADDAAVVTETDESNNCAAAPATLTIAYANLITTTVSNPPSTAGLGASFTVTDTVQNTSTVTAIASTSRYYLSTDSAKDASDVLLSGTRSVPSLASGASSTGSRSVTVPATTAPGPYRVVACADDTLSLKESDESNNCTASATTVLIGTPDLVTTSVSNPPATAAPGSSFTATDTVQNMSSIAAGASTTRYYLSLDGVKSTDDTLMSTSRSVGTLAPSAVSSGSKSVAVPASMAFGTYRLLACADDQKTVNESDEANNCLSSATEVVVARPDLVTTNVNNPPSAIVPGGSFTATDIVQNTGAAAAVASTSRYYLSVDAIKDAGDLLLSNSRSVPGLVPGATSTGSKTVTVPAGTPPGTYRLLACSDDPPKIVESDESNNCTASAGSVTVGWPDLIVTTVSDPPAYASPDGTFTISETVANQGVATAGSSTVRYYLSADALKDAGDALLSGTRSVNSLSPAASSAGSKTVTVPAGTASGIYTVLVCADDLGSVAESDNANNCRASAQFEIGPPSAALSDARPSHPLSRSRVNASAPSPIVRSW